MSTRAPDTEHAARQRCLAAELAVIGKRLARCLASTRGRDVADVDRELRTACDEAASARQALEHPAPLDILCGTFGLASFERDLLLLCTGVELDGSIAATCAELQGDGAPTFSLALAALPHAAWGPLSPDAPLRFWQLVELGNGPTFATRRLQIDEYILNYLLGLTTIDARLLGFFEPAEVPSVLSSSQQAMAERISALWRHEQAGTAISLAGPSLQALRAVAAQATTRCGLHLHIVNACDLPETSPEQLAAARLWQRHAVLTSSALMIEVADDAHARRAEAFARRLQSAFFIAAAEPLELRGHRVARIEVSKPPRHEQRALWHEAIGSSARDLSDCFDAIVAQFDFDTDDILSVVTQVRLRHEGAGSDPSAVLWDACRAQARPRLEHLAQHIDARATWDELVLDGGQVSLLREIALHVRHKVRVYDAWGFAARSGRGLGISALFAGPSGTGKTTAAEVLARELGLDLYRIDLSAVVSKYIGETEKNLRQIFDAAENGGAILLFDEADALFGKRSEVKDSHDRYANMEVSYLLQRMEAYRGLAILTSNLRDTIDSAFMRRIRFVVEFPFPSQEHRAAIWKRMFPPDAPTEGLDYTKLSRLNLSGGSIRNVAMNGAFRAADEGIPIGMQHLKQAARAELAKLERVVPERDLKDWT